MANYAWVAPTFDRSNNMRGVAVFVRRPEENDHLCLVEFVAGPRVSLQKAHKLADEYCERYNQGVN